MVLTDGSKIITEALVRAGAEVYVGYPITPSKLFYSYAQNRFPSFYAASDEISVTESQSGGFSHIIPDLMAFAIGFRHLGL